MPSFFLFEEMPLRSRYPDLAIADASVSQYVLGQVEKHPADRIALKDSSTGESLTYGEIGPLTNRLACGLRDQGLLKGDVVTVCLSNCVQYPVLLMACYRNGATVSTVNANFTADEFLDHFENAGSRFLFASVGNLSIVAEAAAKLKGQIKKIFLLGGNGEQRIGKTEMADGLVYAYESLLNNGGDQDNRLQVNTSIRPKTDVAWMPSSSGTTGKPKCLMLSHYNVVGMIQIFGNPHFPQLSSGDHVIGQLPMYHMYGFTVMWMSLVKGATMVVMGKFDQRTFLQLVQTYRVPILYIVPPILVFLAKHRLVDQYDISSVRTIVVRSAPISMQLSMEATNRHRNVKYLLQAFGMSEVGAAMMVPPTSQDQVRHGSCGVLMPNFQAKIMDLETDRELGPNKSGELYLKSETRMLGYWRNEKATSEAIDPNEGWLRTGDVAYYDDDGHFYIVDRLKEMIKVNAYQVAPAELEGVLLAHPDVQDAAVFGIADPKTGEAPRAVVVKKQGATITQQDLINYVAGKLASYKGLRGGLEFLDAIPKSPSGKILRRVLRDKYSRDKSMVLKSNL